MPGGDRTGPFGSGSMTTGRAAGYWAGYRRPRYMNPVPGRGWFGSGCGWFSRGGSRGRKNWYWITGLPGWMRTAQGYPTFGGRINPCLREPAVKEELEMLKSCAEGLKQQLQDVQSRISTLEKSEATGNE